MATNAQPEAMRPRGTSVASGHAEVAEEKLYVASNAQLIWWKFRRHRLALVCTLITAAFYVVGAFCEFIAPYDPQEKLVQVKLAPPSRIHMIDQDGRLRSPFIYGTTKVPNLETMVPSYPEDESRVYPIRLFVTSNDYRLWGIVPLNKKLFGLDVSRSEQSLSLAGTDHVGRDLFSRVVYGARLSLSIGLVGVVLSMTVGILLGGISGYYGGVADNLIQRVIEFLRSIPSIPLWMALSAALPLTWPISRIYFGITVILSLVGWTGMARVVRGRFLSLRQEDFVMAARLAGASEMRIIVRHMVPCFTSHIIASMTLSIPGMILSETSLSFLGLGLREPAISWGVLLSSAQNLASIMLAPWRLWAPGISVVVAVLAINFMGDGLRDAADPYTR